MRRASALDYVQEATIFGNSVHLLVPDAKTHDDLMSDLTEPASRSRCVPITPSLEDVFVRLQPEAEAGNGAALGGKES
jgi:hypothetical protein